jgi:molybdate transport system substrate-binding protein
MSHGPKKAVRDRRFVLAGLGGSALAACSPTPAPKATSILTVFAAASLTDVLDVLIGAWQARTGDTVRLSLAASGAVARQVELGAPADLVILAEPVWMDRLVAAGRIRPGTRVDLLGNRLVLIAEAGPGAAAVSGGDAETVLMASEGRIAIGDPASVPAGAYAQRWLMTRRLWRRVQSRLVLGADVRAVRTFVTRGEAELGFVYRSDAIANPAVRIVSEPPWTEMAAIVYPAALTPEASTEAAAFLAFLRSPESSAVFRRFGFEPRA